MLQNPKLVPMDFQRERGEGGFSFEWLELDVEGRGI